MKYLTFYHPEKFTPPTETHMAEMGKFMEEMIKEGVLVTTGGVPAAGFKVRKSGQKLTVTDGPFAESKEVLIGFALLEVKSKEHLLEVTRRFMDIAGDGESEILEVYSEPPPKIAG